jgi:hypothetical protein
MGHFLGCVFVIVIDDDWALCWNGIAQQSDSLSVKFLVPDPFVREGCDRWQTKSCNLDDELEIENRIRKSDGQGWLH